MFKLLPFIKKTVRLKSNETIDWGVRLLGAPDVWKLNQGEGVSIAVLDTGCDFKHQDLSTNIIFKKNKPIGFNAVKNNNDIIDKQSHGTHCAGIIAAAKNGVGIIGVAPKAKIIPIKVLNDDGAGEIEWIIAGINWCIENAKIYNIKILSMSLGATLGDIRLKNALITAKEKGLITICAAGNEGNFEDLGYPARYAEDKLCIAVGAIKSNKKITDFSNTGKGMTKMGIVAPGFNVLSCIPNNKYAVFSGTSMAAPHISGLLALAVSKHLKFGGQTPINNLDDAFEHIRRISVDLGVIGADKIYGVGVPIIDEQKFQTLNYKKKNR